MSPGTNSGYRQVLWSSISHHDSCYGNLFLNLLDGVLSLEFHQEIEDHAEKHDGDDDQSTNVLSE